MTAPVKFFETSIDEPFRRVNVPGNHRFGSDEPEVPTASISDRISGDGYSCGCRSIRDYDKKIGKKIGQDLSDTLAKAIPFYAAFRGFQAGLSAFASKLPLVGPKLSELIDDADPIKALLKFLGGEVDALLVESLFRNVPAWVPVLRNSRDASAFEEQEVQGILVRSHQRYDGVPYSQWHRWYDWSFVVTPVGPSAEIIGRGNRLRTSGNNDLDQLKLDSRRYEKHWMPPGANIEFTIQCELDLGVIGEAVPPTSDVQNERTEQNAFFNIGPLTRDWGWPMAGQYFWCGGRSVYDCRSTTSDDKAEGLHQNQLHPIKALATARFEGFRFKENRQPVPAVQFCFFATNAKKSGGDFQFAKFGEVDYEFVIQLPPGGFGVDSPDPHAIGALPQFSLNTIDIGRRLLADVNFEPFTHGTHQAGHRQCPDPIITPVQTVPGRAPTHVHVKVPFTKLPSDADSCGFVLSLGWHDPIGVLARDMFEVDVEFKELEVHEDNETVTNAEFFLNFAANGRWFQRFFVIPSASQKEPFRADIFNARVTMLLSSKDRVFVCAHGMEEDGEGDQFKLPLGEQNLEEPPPDAPKSDWEAFLDASLKSRQLRLSKTLQVPTGVDDKGNLKREQVDMPFVGDVVDWKKDMDQPVPRLAEDQTRASEVARALFLRSATYLFDSNDILGLIDQNIFDPKQQFGRKNDNKDSPNPRLVSDVLARVPLGVPLDCFHTAYATTRVGRMKILALDETPRDFSDDNDPREVHDAEIDYILKYTITVRRLGTLPPPLPPPVPPPPPKPEVVTIRPDSVNVRVVPGPTIVPASVDVKVVPGPTIVPPSVVVRVDPGPAIVPASVVVRVDPGPVIAPSSVSVRVTPGPTIEPGSVNVRITSP